MAAIDWNAVVDFAAGLSTVAAGAQTVILDLVNTELNVNALGGETSAKLRLVRIFLAAHLGDLSLKRGGASGFAGPVSSETYADDQIRIDYAASVAQNETALKETVYGRQFLALVRNSPARTPFAL